MSVWETSHDKAKHNPSGRTFKQCSKCRFSVALHECSTHEYLGTFVCDECKKREQREAAERDARSRRMQNATTGQTTAARPSYGYGSGQTQGTSDAKVFGILVLIALVCAAVYWIVRFSVYASGLVWIPALVVCAPLWLRIFVGPEALRRHKQLAQSALAAGVAPLIAYWIASEFDMLSNPFLSTSFSLGDLLRASLGICILAGGGSWLICLFHARLAKSSPAACANHGAGALALIPRLNAQGRWSYSVDALLAISAAVALFLGGLPAQIGAVVAAILIYTWCCDYVFRDRPAFDASVSRLETAISAWFRSITSTIAQKLRATFKKAPHTAPGSARPTATR
jgi:hypothetical protein